MSIRTGDLGLESEIEKCLLRNTRTAARVMVRRFVGHMRRFDVSTVRFSLIASIVGAEHNSVSAFAKLSTGHLLGAAGANEFGGVHAALIFSLTLIRFCA